MSRDEIMDNVPTEDRRGLKSLLLRSGVAAKMLAISPRKLWELTNRGDVPCVRIGRAVRYDPRDLAEWIDAQKTRGMGSRSSPRTRRAEAGAN